MVQRLLFTLFTFYMLPTARAALPYTPSSHCDQKLEKTYYTICYSQEDRQARWTYHSLFLESINGPQGRTNNFRADEKLKFSPVQHNDLQPTPYDRGHLVPAADMKLNYNAMSETFLMSNISPQVANFNRGIWSQLEQTLRRLVRSFGDGYVVTGAIIDAHPKKVIKGISLPQAFYKILYIPNVERMYAFLMENKTYKRREVWQYVISVDQLEELTGINFFAELDDQLEASLEAALNYEPIEFKKLNQAQMQLEILDQGSVR